MGLFRNRGKRAGDGVPVLIANGFSPAFGPPMHLVQFRLEQLGFPSEVIPFRLSDNRDVFAFGVHVATYVLSYCLRHKIEKVNLLGISMGGVAGVLALKRHDIAPHVATFVSVAAPLLGSPRYALGLPTGVFTKLGLQMRPYNPLLTKLAREPLPEGPRYVSVAGSQDNTCPPWSALLPGSTQILLPFNHFGVLGKSSVINAVAPHLQKYPPR